MIYEEFQAGVQELGLEIKDKPIRLEVYGADSNLLGSVSKATEMSFGAEWLALEWCLDAKSRQKLYGLLMGLAETPLAEREGPRYWLRHRYVKRCSDDDDFADAFLNLCTDSFGNMGVKLLDAPQTEVHKTEFTKREIEELKRYYRTDLADYELIEVEE